MYRESGLAGFFAYGGKFMLRETFEIMQKIGVPTGRLDYPSFASQRGGGTAEKAFVIAVHFRGESAGL